MAIDVLAADRGVQVLKVFPGKAFGLRQPGLLACCKVATPIQADWNGIDTLMAGFLPSDAAAESKGSGTSEEVQLLDRVASWTTGIQTSAGLPVFEPPLIIRRTVSASAVRALLAVPYAPGRYLAAVSSLRWAWRCVTLLTSDETRFSAETRSVVLLSIESLLQSLRAVAPQNSNSLRFLKAVHDRGTPWDLVTRSVYQFGWGSKARLMEGAFTDEGGMIGAWLARNKDACAELLRRIGLPAPEHRRATSPSASVQVAAELGYPVVVKPADLDGGVCVATNLRTPDQVREAYLAASKVSKRILIEKHVTGQDYRLVVFNSELIWSILRRPGGVIGDGTHTVRQLVDTVNADSKRGEGPRSPLKRLKLDDEAMGLLVESSLTLESVPPQGHFIRLRRTANVATGGTPIAVNDKVHPDNRQLAIDVAEMVRLDLVGLDLLIEDISRSWHEVGCTICEVNGDPQLGIMTQQHLYGDIIGVLCKGVGRIPSVVILGAGRARLIAELVESTCSPQGLTVGIASSTNVWIAGQQVTTQAANVFVAAQMLLANRGVEIAMIAIEDDEVLETSLPLDRIDALVVADGLASTKGNALARLVRMLAGNSAAIIINGDVATCRAAASALDQTDSWLCFGGNQNLASAISTLIETTDTSERCLGTPTVDMPDAAANGDHARWSDSAGLVRVPD